LQIRLWRRAWAEAAFPDEEAAQNFFAQIRWPQGPYCPFCGGHNIMARSLAEKCHCRSCRKRFCLRTKTLFAQSKLPLRTWLIAIRLIVSHPRAIKSVTLAQDLKVTQTTAWFLLRRLKQAIGAQGTKFSVHDKYALLDLLIVQKAECSESPPRQRILQSSER
jgi:transposase-like protein